LHEYLTCVNRLDEVLDDFGECDAVVHLAASAFVQQSLSCPSHYWHNNLIETYELLCQTTDHFIPRFVFASSCAVYGDAGLGSSITEDFPKLPCSPYGHTKLACEQLIHDFCHAYSIGAVALRLFNVAGCGAGLRENHEPETHLIPSVIDKVINRIPIQIYNPQAMRDYVDVHDVARAFVTATVDGVISKTFRVFNIASGVSRSTIDVVRAIESELGFRGILETHPQRSGDPTNVHANIEWAERYLGWTPQVDFQTTIASAIKSRL
jgi:UDP-glucose 4-epimerase